MRITADLAFIGYFCCQAGVALCISKSLVTVSDWGYLLEPRYLLLATPGLLAALLLTWLSRKAENPAALPMAMVAIPAIFYLIIYTTGIGLEGAREGDWVGPVAPPVPVSDLIRLVDLSLVRWDLVGDILWTWVGMIFVVSFASCLDVAAISMDMGEALDTNRELATVGICNCTFFVILFGLLKCEDLLTLVHLQSCRGSDWGSRDHIFSRRRFLLTALEYTLDGSEFSFAWSTCWWLCRL